MKAPTIIVLVLLLRVICWSQTPWPNMFDGNYAIGRLTNGFGTSIQVYDTPGRPDRC